MSDKSLKDIIQKSKERAAVELDLSNLGLKEFPVEVLELTKLKKLDLSHNEILSVPDGIGKLSCLQILYLNHNKLTVPAQLGKLSNLEFLYLCNNELKSIPSELSKLKKLQTLDVSYNNLDTIPVELSQLHSLQTFGVAGNVFRNIPREICEMGCVGLNDYKNFYNDKDELDMR